MKFDRYSAVLTILVLAAFSGCGGGNGSGSTGGGGGGGGTPPPFQARPFPGDFFALPPETEFALRLPEFPANVVYSSKLKEFFFSNNALNEVEAYSSVDGHRLGAVTIPGAMGLSLSPDGTQLAVGTMTPQIYFVDPAALHVTGRVEVPTSVMDPATGYAAVMPFLMAAGPMLVEAAPPGTFLNGGGDLLSYNPGTGDFAMANPPGIFQGVSGAVPARSLDGNYLAIPTLVSGGSQMTVYSAQSQTYIGSTPIVYSLSSVAANPDGSQFAMVSVPIFGMAQTVTFWNRNMQQQGVYATANSSIVYSRDGRHLYIRETTDVLSLDAQTGIVAGFQGLAPPRQGILWDTDESSRVYGIAGPGAFVASVTQLQSAAPQLQLSSLDGISLGIPDEGPLSGGTQVQFVPAVPGPTQSSDAILSSMEAYFGTTPATKDVVGPSATGTYNILTATSPAASANGPVTVLLTDGNGDAEFFPGFFSYGPHVHWIDPSAVSPAGGTVSRFRADGIQENLANNPSVSYGGAAAGVTLPSPYPQLISVSAPSGTPGWADLKISLADGTSETTKNSVQYLAQDVTLASATYTSIVYDSTRDRFYLTGADNTVGLFDPATRTLLQPIRSQAVSTGAVFASLALTPDNSKLLVSNPTDHSLVVFNLADNTSTAVNVLLASDGAATVGSPMPVVALTGNRALVLLPQLARNQVRQIDFAQMTVTVRTDVKPGPLFSVAPSTMAASSDGSTVLLGGSNGSNPPYYVWRYDTGTDTFSAPVTSSGNSVAVNEDGTVLGAGFFTLDQNLLPVVPLIAAYTGLLPGTGALQYSVPNNVQIVDSRSGRRLLSVGPLSGNGSLTGFAVDPSGRKILLSGINSLTYYELSVVPLAVATVTPITAAPGASVTIRGSGFVAGTTAKIAGKSTSCSLVDARTLQCAVPEANAGLAPMTLSNPDGQTYALEAAVNVQ
jgi:WD40 repeat protein